MARITVYDQEDGPEDWQSSGVTPIKARGPTIVGGSLGLQPFRNCHRWSNGYATANTGDFWYSRIVVDMDFDIQVVERLNVRQTGPRQYTIGGTPGGDFWDVQRPLHVRFAPVGQDPLAVPQVQFVARLGTLEIPLPRALKGQYAYGRQWEQNVLHGVTGGDGGWMETGALGPFQPGGPAEAGRGGFDDIEIVYGREQDSATALMKHDLCWDRMPIDCLDPITGMPLPSPVLGPKGYNLERGAFINATLPIFYTKLNADPSDLRAVARKVNAGVSAYEGALRQHLAHNGQHLNRASSVAFAAARLFGDQAAGFNLQMLAMDARYAHPSASESVPGHGSTFYGRREPGWIMQLWAELGQRNPIAPETAECITPAKRIMMVPRIPDPSFVPHPWDDKDGGVLTHQLPTTESVGQSQEELAATVHGLISSGHADLAIEVCASQMLDPNSLSRRLTHVPRFFASGNAAGPYTTVLDGAYNPSGADADFASLLAAGTMLCLDRARRREWLNACAILLNVFAPTGYRPLNANNLYAAFKYDYATRGQNGALLSGLENP